MTDRAADSQVRSWLRARASLPLAWTIPEDEPADSVAARTYTHPGLNDDRVIVRLVPRALEMAEDAALGVLGFMPTAPGPPVAHARRQFPGFAATVWLARSSATQTAFAALKEVQPLARLAREKPGAARAGYEAWGERLAIAQPELLPVYFEEAARAFLDAGQAAQAAAMFARARDVERRYPHAVDAAHREEAFFEFASAGALNGGVLDDYAEELSRRLPPLEGYRQFRRLCVQRTISGTPPWAGMGTALNTLATAAELDVDAEAEALLQELLPDSSIGRAAVGFWKTYRRALVELAQKSAAVQGRLLNLMPTPPRYAAEFADWWLRLLDASGATTALVMAENGVLPEARPRDGAAAWLARLTVTYSHGGAAESARPSLLPDLLRRMADRLRSEGRPLDLFGGRSWGLDLELVDLALSLGLPVQPPKDGKLVLNQWLKRRTPDGLPHLAADLTFGPLLEQAVDEHMVGNHVDALVRIPGVRPMLEQWLDRAASGMTEGCLLDVNEVLDNIESSASSRSLADLSPAALERLRRADIAAALQRTLAAGLIDEYGWPALEEARARLTPGREGVSMHAAWPNLIVSDGVKVFVVGPEHVVLEHDLRPPEPKASGFSSLLYAGGQLLCAWYTADGWRAYWSGRPGDYFDVADLPSGFGRGYTGLLGASFEVDDTGRTAGSRAVHPGDTRIPRFRHMLTDGAKFWRTATSPNRFQHVASGFEEYDPVSGRSVGSSLPPFLEVDAEAESELVPNLCWLLPVPSEIADSTPFGSVDGLAGWRVRRNTATLQLDCLGLDGRGFSGRLLSSSRPVTHTGRSVDPLALMRFPGDDRLRPVGLQYNTIVMHDPSGRHQLLKAPIGANRLHLTNGTLLLPPPLFWQCLRPRDESGSRALRGISLEKAQILMRCAFEEWNQENTYPRTLELIKDQLPEITAPPLRSGVLGAVVYAALLERQRASSEVLRRTEPVPVEAAPVDGLVVDADLQKALGSVTEGAGATPHWQSNETLSSMAQLRTVSDYFAAVLSGREDEPPKLLPQTTFVWELLVGRIGAAAYLAASPFVDDARREALLRFLEFWRETPFTTAAQHFRVAGMTEPTTTWATGARLERQEDHAFFIRALLPFPIRSLTVLECSRGESRFPADKTVVWRRPPSSSWDEPRRISDLIERVRRDGPFQWSAEAAQHLAELSGITRAEAALILAGFPNFADHRHTFLDSALRELLGLKSTEAHAARNSLQRIPAYQRLELLSACMPTNAEQLWDSLEPTACQVAAVWRELLGQRIRVPDELVVAVQGEIESAREPHGYTAQAALSAMVSPETEPRLHADAQCWIAADTSLQNGATTEHRVFDESTLRTMSRLITWMSLHRPVGDAVRSGIPRVVELLRERLHNPQLLFSGKLLKSALVEALQTPPYTPPQGAAYPNSRDLGWAVLVSRYQLMMNTYLRPSHLTGDESAEMVTLFGFEALVRLVRFVTGEGAASIARRVERTPVPDGGFEANPALSAPRLVKEVSDALKLSESAAALYMQLLTLSEITMKNAMLWNAWSAAEYKAAASELARLELVVTGKRPRAGREIFLPGAWLRGGPPNLPMEAWKLPLYDGTGLDGRYLPMRALHELFGAAWERIKTGDEPRGGD